MQHKNNPLAGSPACIRVANIAFDKAEAAPLIRRHGAFNLSKIRPVSGGEIVETDYVLVEAQKRLQKITANEAGSSGNQPLLRGLDQVCAQLLIACHSLHILNPASRMAVRSNADLTSIKTPPFFNRAKSSRRGILW